MPRRLPLLPTIVVLAAVAVMIRLGFWQLDRMHQKGALLARYDAATSSDFTIPLPTTARARLAHLYEPATAICAKAESQRMIGGRNRKEQSGWVQIVQCRDPDGVLFDVAIGWSERPIVVPWQGGPLHGRIGSAGKDRTRLVADFGQNGLRAVARPDPRNIPNNHFAYAVQWFLFAATALVIFALAVRRKLRES